MLGFPMAVGSDELRPVSLKRDGDGLRIEWSDGVNTFVTWKQLRTNCPCASCNEVRKRPPNPFKVLTAKELEAGAPAPKAMKAVGHYAYQITWNDGHDSGIFTLVALRSLSSPVC